MCVYVCVEKVELLNIIFPNCNKNVEGVEIYTEKRVFCVYILSVCVLPVGEK